jgi:hypothetical protein
MKAVEVALAEEVETAKRGRLEREEVAERERTAQGLVEEMPTRFAPAA